jgi:PAS domain S-box-containing protein
MQNNITSIELISEQIDPQRLAELEALVAKHEQREAELEHLLAAEQQQRQLAEMLYQTSTALSSTLNYEEVLDRILEQAREIIPHDAASMMLVEGEVARTFRRRGYASFDANDHKTATSLNIAGTPTLRLMQETGRPLVISAVDQDKTWVTKPQIGWVKSYLGAPIYIQNRLIGFLNLNSATPDHFKLDDVDRLQAFICQAAIALKNARLYDQGRQEIVERVRALKRERNFISAVLDTAGALVMVLSRHGRIIRFNRACEQTTGYLFEEVRGKFWWNLFLPPDEIEPIKAEFETLWLNQPPKQYEGYWVTKEGQWRLIAWSNTVLFDAKGAIEYILNTGIDLTARKQAEEALQSSEERFREVVSSISDHVYVTRLAEDGRPLNLYLSPHVEGLTGYPREKFMADWRFWPDCVIHLDDQAAAAAQAAKLAAGQNSEMEYRLVRADGAIIWVRDSARSQGDDLSRIIYGVVSDITARKQAEEQLRITNQQLQELTNRLQEELTLAQKIQQSLLPTGRPAWAGLDVICHSVPAREVGGDFYAYHAFTPQSLPLEGMKGGERFAIAVGDVSGKGMPAALLMAASLTALQSVIARAADPSDLLVELDLALKPYTKTTLQNCALCYAEITPPRPEQTTGLLRVANAGCVTPLIRRAGGTVEWVDVGGLPLGVGLGSRSGYAEATFSLNPGDLIIFTSDGVIEATNAAHQLFSFERLEQAVAAGPKTSAAAMLAHLRAEVTAFAGETEPHDDLTIVVVQV